MTRINRRQFLIGSASTIVALPLFEFMLNSKGSAFAADTALPKRMLLFHTPTSLVISSRSAVDVMTPQGAGTGYTIPAGLAAITDYGLKPDLSIVTGLYVSADVAKGVGVGVGGYDLDYHGQARKAMVTGVTHGKTYQGDNAWLPFGRSPDQVYADAIGAQTKFPFLLLQLDTTVGGDGRASYYRKSATSWEYRAADVSPLAVYKRLFTNFTAPGEAPKEDLAKRLRESSLSYVKDDLNRLRASLGAADRMKLDAHLQNIRDLETRLAAQQAPAPVGECRKLDIPAADPADIDQIPDIQGRYDLFFDLVHMAFACDLTRSICLNVASQTTGNGMRHPAFKAMGGWHDVQHASNQANLNTINEWQFRQFAKLVKKLKDSPEGAGNLLDNTVAVYANEGGKGGRTADGGADPNHSTDNMMMVVAGRAGGLKPGRHIILDNKNAPLPDLHTMKVYNAALKAVGCPESGESEIKGYLAALFG